MSDRYNVSEIERTQANMIRLGVITELDEANARVKVACGGLSTDWLPWGTARAGATRTWSPPQVGEQVCVFSPYGDPAQAFVGHSIFQDDFPAPATSKDQETAVFSDGTTIDYNSATNTLTVNIAGAGVAHITCKQATVEAETSVTLDTPETHITGNVQVDGNMGVTGAMDVKGEGAGGAVSTFHGTINITGGDVTADSIRLKGHGHIEQGDGNRTSNAVA